MASAYFLHQIKHTNSKWEKGIVVKSEKPTSKENYDDVLQGYHAYLGAYAYGHDANTDYVFCEISDEQGNRPLWEYWDGRVQNTETAQE